MREAEAAAATAKEEEHSAAAAAAAALAAMNEEQSALAATLAATKEGKAAAQEEEEAGAALAAAREEQAGAALAAQKEGQAAAALEEQAAAAAGGGSVRICVSEGVAAPPKASQVGGAESPRVRYDIEAVDLCVEAAPPLPAWRSLLLRGWQRRRPARQGRRRILRHVSFAARAGEVLAVAGPSGAGKSTLLETLAGRARAASGALLVNGAAADFEHFRRVSGYVMQHDALFPLLTVRETLLFSAQLRLPAALPAAEKAARVTALLAELGLLHVADCRVGEAGGGGGGGRGGGVSGGERRRVSIGVDVVHDPAVLLLDEPTSGLDSAGALQVVAMLNAMAEAHGRTIVLSIHQPGFRILQLVHSVLLLANGAVIHHGPVSLLATRLAAAGHRIPQQVNVLEYAIDTIDLFEAERSGVLPSAAARSDKVGLHGSLSDLFLLSGQLTKDDLRSSDDGGGCEPLTHHNNGSSHSNSRGGSADRVNGGTDPAAAAERVDYANSRLREVGILCRRFSKNIVRTRQLFAARTLQAAAAGLGLGSIFLRLPRTARGVQERYGFFAFTLTFLLSSTTEALPLYLQERAILARETSRGAYRVSSYVLSNAIVFLPFLFVCSLLYSAPTYWLVGLNPALEPYLFFLLTLWLIVLTANSFVAFFSALVPNFIVGYSLISGSMGAFFLFSGYFIARDSIPRYWLFMHYLSLFKYPLDALLINEYSPPSAWPRLASPVSRRNCFSAAPPAPAAPAAAGSSGSTAAAAASSCSLSGADVLRQVGLLGESKWADLAVMLAFAIAYRCLCAVVLYFKMARR